ncbi:MAG: hypothetical protein ACOC44_10085 [Promethearchaeia archaeon]
MIICSNCGATNSEHDGGFCRKCGAPLPVSKERTRITLTNIPGVGDSNKKEKTEAKNNSAQNTQRNQEKIPQNTSPNAEVRFFSTDQKNQSQEQKTSEEKNLQAIPQNSQQTSQEQHQSDSRPQNLTPINSSNNQGSQQRTSQSTQQSNQNSDDFLKEITPQPFNEPVIQRREVYGRSTPQSQQKDRNRQDSSKPEIKPIPHGNPNQSEQQVKSSSQSSSTGRRSAQQTEIETPSTSRGQKQIEEDMQEVLEVLSKKLVIPSPEKKESFEEESVKEEKAEEELPPQSMNDILKKLFKIDLNIEASAIVKEDGTILASAISNRVSDTLFATIGQTLSMIGADIVEGLSAGQLKTISLKGTKGILDLAPINSRFKMTNGMFLILFSKPRVKSGVINIAVNSAKKQIKEYLGLHDEDQSL